MRHPGEYSKLRRRDKTSGAHIYLNADALQKALRNAGIPDDTMNLKAKVYDCKDGKRANILIHVTKIEKMSVVFSRIWAMPNKNTFTIKPIKEIISKYLNGVIVDPFANNSKLGTITNDLNPEFKTDYTLDALKFLQIMETNSADVVLYDPPFSISQAAECYRNFGKEKLKQSVANMGYWGSCKNEVARILKPNGICVICGWSSMGLGVNRGFEMLKILLVPHGGSKNDTIVTVERKLE